MKWTIPIIAILIILVVFFVAFNQLASHPCLQGSWPIVSKETINIYRNALGDGCYHVFIDAGSNVGVHGRFLFEPKKYPRSVFAKKFNVLFGTHRTRQNICVFAFEPNPTHRRSQLSTELFYGNMGWRYHFMPYGVSDFDGNYTFYRNSIYDSDGTNEEWGFGIFAAPGNLSELEAVVVKVVNISSWLEKNILERDIPIQNQYNTLPPTLVLKIDIEGAEYKVLEHLLDTGVSHQLDYIIGEFHSLYDVTNADIVTLQKNITARLEQNEGPGFLEFDDEQYLHDGMEYPFPSLR